MVYIDLVGGDNGHFGLVLSPDKYNFISLTMFILPLNPRLLVISTGTTKFIVTAMQANHKELIRIFKAVLSVEATLRQKIITAVDVKYIADLSDRNTNSINNTIDVILKHLFNTYGKLTPQMLT